MNARVFILLAAACALLGLSAGCSSPSAETGRNNNPTIVMELDPNVTRAVATIHIGDEVQFVLPAGRGPDYIWQIVSNDPRCLRQSSGVIFKAGATEATGTSSVKFIAQRPSRSFVRFAYVPAAGGKETELVDAYEIVVTVKG